MAICLDKDRVARILREDDVAPASDSTVAQSLKWTSGSSSLDGLIKQNGERFGVDPYLIFCVMEQESHFNRWAQSPKGARGLMQLMPGTGARFGVRRPFDPAQNIHGGTMYLKQLLQEFNGRVDLVLAGYNAGGNAVARFGDRVPPYRETRNYVRKVGLRYSAQRPIEPRDVPVGGVPASR
jgi:soluble lytic murein transglycosylase-like protein